MTGLETIANFGKKKMENGGGYYMTLILLLDLKKVMTIHSII